MDHPLKQDESRLLEKLREREQNQSRKSADNFFAELGIAPKRGYYILQKFTNWGWWEYGVSLRTGWLVQPSHSSTGAISTTAGTHARS